MLKKANTNRKGFTPLEIKISNRASKRFLTGFTVIELMIAMIFLGIVTVGVGIVLADSQRGWNQMYNRIYSGVVTDGHVARRMFDTVIRKASRQNIQVDGAGTWVEVDYYADANSVVVDRYARFYVSVGELKVEHGNLDPGDVLSTQRVCSNVSACVFTVTGPAVQMVLKLDNGSETATVMSSAVTHN